MRRLARPVAAVAVAAPLTLLLTATAYAEPMPYVHPIRGIVASGNYTGAVVNGVVTVAFECHAVADAAVSVAITNCSLSSGPSAHPIALPGGVAATAAEAKVALAPFQLCWAATATYVDSLTNSTSGCTLLQSAAAGVPSVSGAGVSEST